MKEEVTVFLSSMMYLMLIGFCLGLGLFMGFSFLLFAGNVLSYVLGLVI